MQRLRYFRESLQDGPIFRDQRHAPLLRDGKEPTAVRAAAAAVHQLQDVLRSHRLLMDRSNSVSSVLGPGSSK